MWKSIYKMLDSGAFGRFVTLCRVSEVPQSNEEIRVSQSHWNRFFFRQHYSCQMSIVGPIAMLESWRRRKGWTYAVSFIWVKEVLFPSQIIFLLKSCLCFSVFQHNVENIIKISLPDQLSTKNRGKVEEKDKTPPQMNYCALLEHFCSKLHGRKLCLACAGNRHWKKWNQIINKRDSVQFKV